MPFNPVIGAPVAAGMRNLGIYNFRETLYLVADTPVASE